MSQKVVYDNEVHFWTTSTWSVWKYHAPATPLLLGHACRKCHVPVFIETRVVTMPWKITLQQHDIVWKPLCRCFWLTLNSSLHDALRRSFHWPIRGPSLWSSGQLEARI